MTMFDRYARSGRLMCQSCKHAIAKGGLRVAVMGPKIGVSLRNLLVPWWYHPGCFVAGIKKNHPAVPLGKLHPELFDGYGDIDEADLENFREVG